MSDQDDDYEYDDIVGDIGDDATRRAILDGIKQQMRQPSDKQNKKATVTNRERYQYNKLSRPMQRVEEEYQDNYQNEIEQIKRKAEYKIQQPQRFKMVGYNSKKAAIFKMTDLYIINDIRIQNMIDQQYERIIYGGRQLGFGFANKFDNRQQIEQIIAKWQNKQQQDFESGRNTMVNEKQLQEIVVNLGQKKQDYFIYKHKQVQPQPIKQVINAPLFHPNFIKNLHRSAYRLAQQFDKVQEFQQISEKEQQSSSSQQNKVENLEQQQFKLFGVLKYSRSKNKKIKPNAYFVEQGENDTQGKFAEQILKQYQYVNPNLFEKDFISRPISDFNRLEIDITNNQFFLQKVNSVLEKHTQYRRLATINKSKLGDGNRSNINGTTLLNDKSILSGSMNTGNKQSIRPSIFGDKGGQLVLQDDNESIQNRIERQMRNQQRQVINHSQIANQYLLVKFSMRFEDFKYFHRYSFPYFGHFNKKVRINLVKNKGLRIKGTDLSINSQLLASFKKYKTVESLSISNDQYIMIQYIEENPLVMSNVGMCQKMLIQVYNQEIIDKIKQDMINQIDFNLLEQRRDQNTSKNQTPNITFQRKCLLWRKNIRQIFGDNGKVYLWEPRKEGKLIGSPEGYGITVMESNLGVTPIIKKKNKPTDFLLVRQNDKWFIRRIDNLYISGQMQPKRQVFNPDSRQVNINFITNYQKAFLKKHFSYQKKISLQTLKNVFFQINQNGIKKVLKSVHAVAEDGKNYALFHQQKVKQPDLTPQDVCLYEKMNHSLSQLEQLGIKRIHNMDKIKQIMSIFFRKNIESLEKFAIAKMIKEQLQLTSWYLTDSFLQFKSGAAKIDLIGIADPTNNHGGYSYIKKPQKQRTQKQQLQQKQQKSKVSGTLADLRKLKAENIKQILLQRGYTKEQVEGKGRWDLVKLVRQQQGTQYERKQRQTKIMKIENEKKQISKIFNRMIKFLNDEEQIGPYNYNKKKTRQLDEYMNNQRPNWERKRQIFNRLGNEAQDQQED